VELHMPISYGEISMEFFCRGGDIQSISYH
jgi:hypothetical protein